MRERCERWKRFLDGVGGDAAKKKKKKHYEVFTRDLVRGVVQHVNERCMEKEIGKTRVVVVLGARREGMGRSLGPSCENGRMNERDWNTSRAIRHRKTRR